MACFITPLAVGIILGILGKRFKGYSRLKLGILVYLLIGGALVLAVEHLWHGEVVLYPPFLTAMQNPEDVPTLLHEVSVVGSSMTFGTAILWLSLLHISKKIEIKSKSMVRVSTTLGT
ncbi:MAG: hypothetical protein QW775_03300 [Ignisphaera sp.]|uniref:Uncharacterized protein n=1 Tax=Ignisphaera aggregans TaxID=334771 RepID=A0A7C4NSA0_9CREN